VSRRAEFPGESVSVAAARRFVDSTLESMAPAVRERATLIVSELATNAVNHARTSFVVAVAEDASAVRIEVTDSGSGVPRPRAPTLAEPHGRGLLIVGAMSDEWGVTERNVGKTVWFSLRGA